jgi:hypothetical protein
MEFAGGAVAQQPHFGRREPGFDFLKSEYSSDVIITNVPFNLSEEFIKHAIDLKVSYFAFILKSQYWHASGRLPLFNMHRPLAIYPLSWRANYSGGARGNRPTMETLWCVWAAKPQAFTRYEPLPRPTKERMKDYI